MQAVVQKLKEASTGSSQPMDALLLHCHVALCSLRSASDFSEVLGKVPLQGRWSRAAMGRGCATQDPSGDG